MDVTTPLTTVAVAAAPLPVGSVMTTVGVWIPAASGEHRDGLDRAGPTVGSGLFA
jgi:hypothetical protein